MSQGKELRFHSQCDRKALKGRKSCFTPRPVSSGLMQSEGTDTAGCAAAWAGVFPGEVHPVSPALGKQE